MENIEAIYIINGKSQLIFSYEIFSEHPNDFDYSNISRFFSVIRTFALKIGEKQVKVIELKNSKIFMSIDYGYNVEVILKCDKYVKEKKASLNLNKIFNSFINSFIGCFNSSIEIKKERMDSFINKISFIIEESGKINFFVENIEIVP